MSNDTYRIIYTVLLSLLGYSVVTVNTTLFAVTYLGAIVTNLYIDNSGCYYD
jgi:hypothetical protein